jgi:hypothetical protein
MLPEPGSRRVGMGAIGAARARFAPRGDGSDRYSFAPLTVMAAAQARGRQWAAAPFDGAEAPGIQVVLVVQRAQPAPLVDLLSLAALDDADRAGETLLPPMGLAEASGVSRVRAVIDAAIGAPAQELPVLATAQPTSLRLLATSGLRA